MSSLLGLAAENLVDVIKTLTPERQESDRFVRRIS